MKVILVALLLIIARPASGFATTCSGKFINPMTDVCWDCLFPISIGDIEIFKGTNKRDTSNPSSPICVCADPLPRVGIAAGFWEPVYMVDVSKRPFCFVNLGGLKIKPPIKIGSGHAYKKNYPGAASWYVHWYTYPLLKILNLIVDFACLDSSGFSLAYITEFDPTWQDDEMSLLLNPEVILFAHPIAQAACAADCIAASVHLPLDFLFWCAGCQGGMYPMNGHIQEHVGSIQSSLLATERMTYKLHRSLLLPKTSGVTALCKSHIMPIINKSQYRAQIINPVPGTGRFACNPYGSTTTLFEAFKEIPVKGEDFGWLIWRKRSCCVL